MWGKYFKVQIYKKRDGAKISNPTHEEIAIGGIANFFANMLGNRNIDSILISIGFGELENHKNKMQKIEQVLKNLYEKNDRNGIFAVVSSLVQNHKLDDAQISSLDQLIAPLGLAMEDGSLIWKDENPIIHEHYIDLKEEELPDSFYYDLIINIDKCYSFGVYSAVRILNRKLLENLLIDLLRKKFGMSEINLFFDTGKKRFYDFNVLLKNVNAKLDDFKPISAALDSELLKKIDKFRDLANSSAHTIELHIKKEELDDDKDDIIFVVRVLSKAIKSLMIEAKKHW